MGYRLRTAALGVSVAMLAGVAGTAFAQKDGGIQKFYHRGTPPSGSIHEEATNSTVSPYMGVYNNLVMYKQDVARNSLESNVPDLAESWSWNDDDTELTFKLRQGVQWHDGKPFTSADVKCTWDLVLGKGKAKLRQEPAQGLVQEP